MIERQLFWHILRCAARFVPFTRRSEWLAEWESELWYALRARPRGDWEVFRFVLGAFKDATWVRSETTTLSPDLWLQSPQSCLAALLVLAAICVSSFVYAEPAGNTAALLVSRNHRIFFWTLFPVLCALVILPSVTTVNLGATFETVNSPASKSRGRRRAFSIVKLALVLIIAFFGAFEFAPPSIQPQVILVGCVLGFRWVLLDHRMRCPVCLRRLVQPVRVGHASRTFLGIYGTELCCDKGHGVMSAPDAITSYTAQRWSDSSHR